MTSVSGTESQSAAEQAKERVQEVAEQAKGQTREQLRSQIADRSTQLGEQLSSAAQAVRRASAQLREEGNERSAGMVDAVADRGQRVGGYLRDSDGEQLLPDIEEFARKQPWLMVGGCALVGFLGARFMKASSHGRYRALQRDGAYPSRAASSIGAGLPPAPARPFGESGQVSLEAVARDAGRRAE